MFREELEALVHPALRVSAGAGKRVGVEAVLQTVQRVPARPAVRDRTPP
ncbi:MAG: hypothetical protein ACYC5S_11205 [Thiobacillus sp.]